MNERQEAQLRRGIERIINIDSDTGLIIRAVMQDNGRGQLIPSGQETTHEVTCRVSYESAGVWKNESWEGGLAPNTTPYVAASPESDIKEGDILKWRGKSYKVQAVSYPLGIALQAPLSGVTNGN